MLHALRRAVLAAARARALAALRAKIGSSYRSRSGSARQGTGRKPGVVRRSCAEDEPAGARPNSNTSRWVTNDDYRSRWNLEKMAGTARFALAIDARGKVTGCTITRSTGHAPLGAATCDLVTKRARFEAARDGTGKPVAGNYSGVITWQIPK